jgi:hypothetical protein
LEIWRSSAASPIFNAFSPDAKVPHLIADIRIGECFVLIMFNQLRMNLRRPIVLFPEIFDEDSLLPGDGRRREDVQELFSSRNFISDEDWPVDFHITLATTRDLSRVAEK